MEYYYIESKDLMIIVISQSITGERVHDIAKEMVEDVKNTGIEHVLVFHGRFELIR